MTSVPSASNCLKKEKSFMLFCLKCCGRMRPSWKGTELSPERLEEFIKTMQQLERFWNAQSQFTGLSSLDDDH